MICPSELTSLDLVADIAGASRPYVLKLIRLFALEPPDRPGGYSPALAPRVLSAVRARRARLIDDTWERHARLSPAPAP